jgi:hypothetical protein
METVLVVVALLACPLMMLTMGGMAWVAARSRGDRPQRLGDEHEAAAPPSSQNRAGSASAGV